MSIRNYMNIINESVQTDESVEPLDEFLGLGKPKRDPNYDDYDPESQAVIDQYATGKSPGTYNKSIKEIDDHPLYPELKRAAIDAWDDKRDPQKTLWDKALGLAEKVADDTGYTAFYIRRYASMAWLR